MTTQPKLPPAFNSEAEEIDAAQTMPEIYVDADACPVKDEVLKVAERHDLKTIMVSDGGIRPHPSPRVKVVVVAQGADAADNWIADTIQAGDIVITNDILLADRCMKNGAGAIRPNGQTFNENSIGMALATRDLMTSMRAAGQITSGPPPFSKQDRSRFLQALHMAIQQSSARRSR